MTIQFALISRILFVGIIIFCIGCSSEPRTEAWISGTWACEGVEPVAEDKEILRSVVMKFDPTESAYNYETFGTATFRDAETMSAKRLVKEGGQAVLTMPELLVSYQYRTIFNATGKATQILDVDKTYDVQKNAEMLMITAPPSGESNAVSYECSKTSNTV
jgi:hypothetical protein